MTGFIAVLYCGGSLEPNLPYLLRVPVYILVLVFFCSVFVLHGGRSPGRQEYVRPTKDSEIMMHPSRHKFEGVHCRLTLAPNYRPLTQGQVEVCRPPVSFQHLIS